MTDKIIEVVTSRETIKLPVERGDRLTFHRSRSAVLIPSGVFTFLGRTTEWVVEETDAGEVYLVEVTEEPR